ncbi:MAG: class I SAM-dependent methyltransferase [Bacteroidetes bacterium]|nr:class I SAM-dependent methyltransferase [Bacteroidota bacterium]
MSRQPQWTGERLETFIQNESTIEHLHRYALAASLVSGKAVLDIACGSGYGTALLAQHAAEVTGMDIDPLTIEKAKTTYKHNNIRFETASTEQIPSADDSFDVVVSFETLEHTDAQEAMLREIKRVLRPGGLLILSTPEKKNYSDKTGYQNPFHKKELYRHELESLLRGHFSHFALYTQQMTLSSVITGASGNGFQQYSGNFSSVEKITAPEALYYVALAADNELPSLPNSVFTGDSVWEQALLQREKMVTGTITYRLGHVLLYPFKLIRQLFKK